MTCFPSEISHTVRAPPCTNTDWHTMMSIVACFSFGNEYICNLTSVLINPNQFYLAFKNSLLYTNNGFHQPCYNCLIHWHCSYGFGRLNEGTPHQWGHHLHWGSWIGQYQGRLGADPWELWTPSKDYGPHWQHTVDCSGAMSCSFQVVDAFGSFIYSIEILCQHCMPINPDSHDLGLSSQKLPGTVEIHQVCQGIQILRAS